ncbi:RINGv domain-containing protein [Rhizoctonia solani AG-1 IA]|uniref:RINGv domain-containing protein n=1 Tax=Thanatephorus cucumeris (strain AG1-IA) TaxID=983506 RepID=L8WQI2_THACA|nr:RINGv domain-containing protein [Rhizoctonia solani AG-1 IA]
MSAPTVYDLQKRTCWICMEEETHPITPSDKPRWIHPCKCTLIAHEICLLTWISESTAPGGSTSANATCCPQCKTPYQIISNKSTLLALMNLVEMGGAVVRKVTMFNGIFFGLLIPATAYGAITARLILGHEMYSFLIGNNPFQWSYPFISLAFQGTQVTQARSLLQIMCISLPMLAYDSAGSPSPASIFSYPPSPTVVLAFLPCAEYSPVQAAYGFAKQKLFDIGAEAIIRFAAYRIRRRLQQHQDTLRRRRPNSRQISESEIQGINQDLDDIQAQQQQIAQHAPEVAPARAEPAAVGERPPVSFLFTTTLMFPFISSAAGTVLNILSERSPAVRTLIGLRKDGIDRRFSRPIASVTGLGFGGGGFFDRLSVATGFGHSEGRLVLRRGWTWDEFEWRNVLGYAIYVVIHDAWDLVYAWLRVTERRSRKIVDRAFEGVDLGSLDLRESWRLDGN